MFSLQIGTVVIVAVLVGAIVFFIYEDIRLRRSIKKRQEEVDRQVYELRMLKEIGERVGYSLNVVEIADIITGSLHQFIEYGAASYMLLEPERVLFKVHLEKSVSREFVDEVRDRMIKSLSALLDRGVEQHDVEEVLSGAILSKETSVSVRSFFNIPLVIADQVVGVITVADPEPGLYQEEDMTLLYKITAQASSAVTKLQEVVAQEEAKLNAMVESMGDGVVMTDTDYRVVVANPAAKSVIGHDAQKPVTIFDFIDNLGGIFDIRGKLEESVRQNKQLSSDRVLVNERFYEIFVLPVTRTGADKNEPLGAVVIFRDVTREAQVERMREDFTSMLVHELRSPLSGIRHITEVLDTVRKKKGVAAYKEYIEMIRSNASEMLVLVNDILDVAKIESGEFGLHVEEASVREMLEDVHAFFAPSADDEHVTFSLVIDESVPKTGHFDRVRMRQVINNLISNAIKFTDSGGVVTLFATVHDVEEKLVDELARAGVSLPQALSFTQPDDLSGGLVIGVLDSGIGISEKDQHELFNKFKQLNRGDEDKGRVGTGLGLVIAKGIVEAHDGTIHVSSEEGVGSVFYFVLPLN